MPALTELQNYRFSEKNQVQSDPQLRFTGRVIFLCGDFRVQIKQGKLLVTNLFVMQKDKMQFAMYTL